MMNQKFLYLACALSAFAAILSFPNGYYLFLRVLLTIGAVSILINNKRYDFWFTCFVVVAILYNPILPIYLYQKSKWIPLNILTGVLFLLMLFKKNISEKPDQTDRKKENPVKQRDKIIKS